MRRFIAVLLMLATLAGAETAEELVAAGNVAYRNGRYAEAEQFYNDALTLAEGNPAAINGLGLVAMARGEYEEALAQMRPLISRFQYDPNFLLNLGTIFKYLGDYGNAISMFRQAYDLDPENPMIVAGLAESLLHEGDLRETLSLTGWLLALEPERAEYHYLHGMAAFLSDDMTEAKESLAETYRLDPSYIYVYEPLFDLYYKADEVEAASTLCADWINLTPNDPRAWRSFAMIDLRKGDFHAALKHASAMLDLGYVENSLIQAISNWLRVTERTLEAHSLWEKVLELEPYNITARSELSRN